MEIIHISDNHGRLPPLPFGRGRFIVCTGDFLPTAKAATREGNVVWPGRNADTKFQERWLEERADEIVEWLCGRPFVWCAGNHDWIDPLPYLDRAGATVVDTNDRFVVFEERSFYGLPWIPEIYGNWNYECNVPQMSSMLDIMDDNLKRKNDGQLPDILLTHSPVCGGFDRTEYGELVGNSVLSQQLFQARRWGDKLPSHILCGHVHTPGVKIMEGSVLVSNAATSVHVIDI